MGNENHSFFHAAMKTRYNSNKIGLLYNTAGQKLEKLEDIQEEIMGFYKGLLGTKASCLPHVDPLLLDKGLFLVGLLHYFFVLRSQKGKLMIEP